METDPGHAGPDTRPMSAAPIRRRPLQTRRFRHVMLLPVLAALTGCALVSPLSGQSERQAQVTVPAAWSNAATADGGDEAGLARWWTTLQDPQLDDLIAQALAASPDLQSARARVRQARASRDLAVAGWFPTLGASAGASRSRSGRAAGSDGASHSLYDAGFDASWEPDVFGGVRHGVTGAEADLAAEAASLAATRVSLVAEVALNYVDLRGYQERLSVARRNAASQAETLQITDWRNQAGLATTLDVEQARSNLEQTRASIPSLAVGQAEAEHRLAQFLGQAPGSLHARLAKAAPLPTVPDRIAEGIPADALRRRPDVEAAERSFAAETARVQQVLATRFPNLSLSGSFGWQSFSRAALGGSASVASSLAASLAATLFDGGRIRSRIEIQDAVQERAMVAYRQAVLTALVDVENALAAYASGRERRDALARAAAAARSAAGLARNLYQAGLTDFQKVLDTERTQLAAEDSLAAAQAQLLTAVIQLYKALGGGWDFPPAASTATPTPGEDRPS